MPHLPAAAPLSPRHSRQNAGFTLVELSIVLVIIGLIIGGVLGGQALIKSAEISATASQIQDYNTNINAFRLNYKGLPGDLKRAQAFLDPNAVNGDGDGIIESDCQGAPVDCETDYGELAGEAAHFWRHLSLANLSGGSYDGSNNVGSALPQPKLGRGHITVYEMGGLNYYHIANLSKYDEPKAALTPEEAFGIDENLDDGKPNTGIVRAVGGYPAGSPVDYEMPDPACADPDETADYKLVNDQVVCQLQIRMN